MSNTFIPFNFAPKGHYHLTNNESQTIPAGEFGLLSIASNLITTQTTVTVNSEVVYKSGFIEAVSVTATGATAGASVALASDGWTEIAHGPNADQPERFSNTSSGGGSVGPSQSIGVSGNASGGGNFLRGVTFRQMAEGQPPMIWVKAGDVVAVSANGQSYVTIHRYDLPS